MMIQRKWFLMVVMLLGLTVQAQEQKTYDQFFLEAMIQREKGNNLRPVAPLSGTES